MGNRSVRAHNKLWTRIQRLFVFLLPLISLLILIAPEHAQLASAPTLMTKTSSTRGIAVESTNLVAEPFAPIAPVPFGQDNRTRIMLFANNLTLLQGDTAAAVTADAEDGNHFH